MKLETLIKAKNTLNAHSKEPLDSPALAYKIFKFISKVKHGAESFYKERLNVISEKYGLRIENGLFLGVNDGNRDAFLADLRGLEQLEVEPVELSLTLEELGEFRLSVAEIATLGEFIKES